MRIAPLLNSVYTKTNYIQNNRPNHFIKNSLVQDSISFKGECKELKNWEVVNYFKKMGVKSKVKLDRTVSVYKYMPKKRDIEKLESLGMDEETLFKQVTQVEGSVDLTNSKLKNLGSVREIGGFLKTGKNLEDFGELIGIGMDLNMVGSPILDYQKIKYVGGNLVTDQRFVYDFFDTKFCIEGDIILQPRRNAY